MNLLLPDLPDGFSLTDKNNLGIQKMDAPP